MGRGVDRLEPFSLSPPSESFPSLHTPSNAAEARSPLTRTALVQVLLFGRKTFLERLPRQRRSAREDQGLEKRREAKIHDELPSPISLRSGVLFFLGSLCESLVRALRALLPVLANGQRRRRRKKKEKLRGQKGRRHSRLQKASFTFLERLPSVVR